MTLKIEDYFHDFRSLQVDDNDSSVLLEIRDSKTSTRETVHLNKQNALLVAQAIIAAANKLT